MRDGLVKDMDLVSFKDFSPRLGHIKAIVVDTCSEKLSSNFPRIDVLGFLDYLLKYMMNLISTEESSSVALLKRPIQTIHGELVFLRSFFEKIVEMRHENEEFQTLWNRVAELAYEVEFLIDSILVEDIRDSCSVAFDSILEEIKTVKGEALKILATKRLGLTVKEFTKRSGHTPSRESGPMINNVVMGLDDKAISVIHRLTRGSSHLQIVPIVGMPGLEKTTLAKYVYSHYAVNSRFHKQAWGTVSQVYHKKNLFLEILACFLSKFPKEFLDMCEEDLALEVKKRLLRNKYLIVLDDMWDTEVWNDLESLFPDNQNGSRVILTSRYHDIAASRKDLIEGPHILRPLTHDESWTLLTMMLYTGKKDLPCPKLCELRKEIVEMCQGLPLTIVILTGILANEDQTCWEKVVKSLNSSIISSIEQCAATLELSYQHLPDYLKACFLYFGAFLEDHEHTTKHLIRLWVAEGFVQVPLVKSAEDMANDYMMGLITRSLVMVSKQRSTGGVKSCRVHHLLHEFCVRKCKEENFLQFVHQSDEPYALRVPNHLRCLCINFNLNNFYNFYQHLSLLFIGCVQDMFHLNFHFQLLCNASFSTFKTAISISTCVCGTYG